MPNLPKRVLQERLHAVRHRCQLFVMQVQLAVVHPGHGQPISLYDAKHQKLASFPSFLARSEQLHRFWKQ
jgi:hypothetical protein